MAKWANYANEAMPLFLVMCLGCGQLGFEALPEAAADADVPEDAFARPDAADAARQDASDAARPDAGLEQGIPDAVSADSAQDAGRDGGAVLSALAAYAINEVGDGQGPLALLDSMEDPVNLPLVYASGSPSFVTTATGRLLRFAGAPGEFTGGALAPVDGTKLASFEGARNGTLELVVQIDTCAGPDDPRFFGFGTGQGAEDGWFAIRAEDDGLAFAASFDGLGSWSALRIPCPADVRRVLHFVIDTDEEEPSERMRVYVDGARASTTEASRSDGLPLRGATLDFRGREPALFLGRAFSTSDFPAAEDIRTNNADIAFAAVYGRALSEAEVISQSRLLARDDR